ncbi:HVA22-like protein K isoform X2 [Tasmannia lanceolata]|uniref:HVA22-like protein K isoform X2 n=1 Tax=Tasmannia lanceolata TaxID=3420 RepID=UPI00406396E8
MAAALLGSTITGEVGLRLLLYPLGSNIVIRAACCSVGTAFPIYSTFKAIENKDPNEQERWLLYWAAYGSFSLVEVFSDKILSWFPVYYYVKFAFLIWLQFPSGDGSRHLYMRHLRPFLLRHQARLNRIAIVVSSEMVRFMTAHQEEIQFVKGLLGRFAMAANQMMKDVIQPRGHATVGGGEPRRHIQGSESDHND